MNSLRVDLAHLWSTLDRRFWLITVLGALASLLVLGIPTAVIPNPLFSRMTPTEPANVVTWLASAPLMGLIAATYLARPIARPDRRGGTSEWRASVGGVGAFLAIGCPICNKVVVGLLGVSGALNVFGPIQPVIGLASVVLLGATAVWQLSRRGRGCADCVTVSGGAIGIQGGG